MFPGQVSGWDRSFLQDLFTLTYLKMINVECDHRFKVCMVGVWWDPLRAGGRGMGAFADPLWQPPLGSPPPILSA